MRLNIEKSSKIPITRYSTKIVLEKIDYTVPLSKNTTPLTEKVVELNEKIVELRVKKNL